MLYPKVFEIVYNSDSKIHLTIHRKSHCDGGLTMFVKGAPERVLDLCSTILIDGCSITLTEQHKIEFWAAYKSISSNGHRVIAFSMCALPGTRFPDNVQFTSEKKNWPIENHTFLGLISLDDPPKEGVRDSIIKLRRAGIKVVMITGDHPLTAEVIIQNS